jgi:hypothetical protein
MKYSLSPDMLYSHSGEKEILIVSLESPDDSVLKISGDLSIYFVDLVEHEFSIQELLEKYETPEEKQLDDFVNYLLKSGIIAEK